MKHELRPEDQPSLPRCHEVAVLFNTQKPAKSPDCVLGIFMHSCESRLSETNSALDVTNYPVYIWMAIISRKCAECTVLNFVSVQDFKGNTVYPRYSRDVTSRVGYCLKCFVSQSNIQIENTIQDGLYASPVCHLLKGLLSSNWNNPSQSFVTGCLLSKNIKTLTTKDITVNSSCHGITAREALF